MGKNKGFTLVEILAIMAVLGIMLILVVPQIGGSTNSKKEKELEKIIGLVENAGKFYHSFNEEEYKIPIDTLVEEDYLTPDLEDPTTGIKLDGCVRVTKDSEGIFNYKYASCESIEVPLIVELNGGTTQNSTNYTLINTDNLTGTTASSVTPSRKTYTGFTSPSAQTVTIAADGSTVVNYYYTRNSYTVTLNKGTGISTVSGAGTYKYGASVTIKATVSTNYEWSKWTGTHNTTTQNYTFTMPAGNVTDTANATLGVVAQAIYFATDNSLTFIRDRLYSVGETYNGKAVTAVYTGFESASYSHSTVPWYSYRETITNVVFKNEIKPLSTAYWFYYFKKCNSFDVTNLNTSNVTNMDGMFCQAGLNSNYKQNLSRWNVSKVVSYEDFNDEVESKVTPPNWVN